MTERWTGDSTYGKNYLIEFKHRGSRPIVEVFAARRDGGQEGMAARVGENATPVESRDLPLNREDATGFTEQYLADLNDREKELVIERLCAEGAG